MQTLKTPEELTRRGALAKASLQIQHKLRANFNRLLYGQGINMLQSRRTRVTSQSA